MIQIHVLEVRILVDALGNRADAGANREDAGPHKACEDREFAVEAPAKARDRKKDANPLGEPRL